ncbi:MAG: hypothetical protein WAM30_19765 [Candidatus Dormiibacterota bacterium]
MDTLRITRRRHLPLIIGAELLVVAAFGIAVWQIVRGREATPPTSTHPVTAPATTGPAATSPAVTPIPLPAGGTPAPAASSAGSGSSTDPGTALLQKLQQANGLVGGLAQTESSVLQILIPGTDWYLLHVVAPRIRQAFHH